jgi:PadR family transcriptional regulator PadR
MKFLSRQEEMLLLSILKLREKAYGVSIREHIARTSGKKWSIGAVYDILDRLTHKGLVKTTISAPLNVRGGKSRRYYTVTKRGFQALAEVHALQKKAWAGLVEAAYAKD